jgi:hypothetical protein
MSRAKALAMLLAAAMVSSLLLLPSSSAERAQSAAAPATMARNTTVLPVAAEYRNGEPKFEGDLTLRRFVKRNGKLKAVGLLDGTVFERNGGERGVVEGKKVTAPVRIPHANNAPSVAQASCDILRLVLGPLDLNLLGLRVQLNRVVLNITAEPGPGNLLGNLLCAVAGLLDRGGLLGILRNLLNAILEVLRMP